MKQKRIYSERVTFRLKPSDRQALNQVCEYSNQQPSTLIRGIVSQFVNFLNVKCNENLNSHSGR